MKKSAFIGALTVATAAAGVVSAATLDDVKAADELKCGVTTGLVGFAAANADGVWEGFDVAVCRAVAAAVLGDSTKVKFVPTTGKTRFTALASGEIDMLARNTTWTFSRDVDLKFEFVGECIGTRVDDLESKLDRFLWRNNGTIPVFQQVFG